MFLQKDLFDGDGEQVPLSRPTSSAGLSGGAASMGRPMTAGSSAGGGEEAEDVATPGSVTNMRAKMMQQRERLLAKQRNGGRGPGSMVMANQGLPVNEASSTPVRKSTTTPTSSGTTPLLGSPTSPGALLSHTLSSLSAAEQDDEDRRGAVMPVAPPVSKEEEDARRRSLQQELSERGICPEYDPAGSGDQRCTFDIGSVAPADFRGFLHNPAPKHAGVMQCRIVRDRGGISTKLHPRYTMESDAGVFMMTAQKQVKNKTSNYSISMSKACGKDADSFLGKLRSDFLGIEWVGYGPGLNPAKTDPKMPTAHQLQHVREELLAVQYTASKWGAATAKGPRKMVVVIPHVTPSGERLVSRTMNPTTEGLLALQRGGVANQRIDMYNNKPPKWNDQIGAYVLNFNKRVTEASVKNFQLISSTDPETVYLQFGRVGKEAFNLDFRYPISPFQAFAMCLSSFDYKLGCE